MNPLLKRRILERQGYSPEEIERIVGAMDTGGAPAPGPAVPMAPQTLPRDPRDSAAVRGINIGREQGMRPSPDTFMGPPAPQYVSNAPRPFPQAITLPRGPQATSTPMPMPQMAMAGPSTLMPAPPSMAPQMARNGQVMSREDVRRGQRFFGSAGIGESLPDVAEARSPELRSLVPPEAPDETEPFERAAQTEEMEAKRNKLEMFRGIAESLGNMDRYGPWTGAEIRAGQKAPEPFVAEGIRAEQAREAERITPDESAFLKTQGYNVAAGMPRSIVAKSIPQYANLSYKRDALEQRQLEEAGRAARGEGNLAERIRSGDLREKFGMRLPPKFRDSLMGYKKALQELDVIGRKAETASFGPIAGRWNQFARKIGLADSETVASAADDINAVNQTIYQSTGKQLNQEEMKRITATMPAIWDSPQTFQAVLQAVKERVRRNMASDLEGLRGDYDISAFEGEVEPAEGGLNVDAMKAPIMNQATPSADGKIRVRNKVTGQTGKLPAANFDPEKYERL